MRETTTLDRGQAEAGTLIALTIGLVVAVTMISVLIPLVDENAGTVTVTNETVTSSATDNTVYDLDGFDLQAGETVYAENGSAGSFVVVPSGDYTIDSSPGEINLTLVGESAGTIDTGDEVLITYDYEATGSTVETILDLLALFLALIALVAISGPIQRRL